MLVRAGLIAGVILFGGYATQTIGLQYTSPSTSAFLTGLYVIITPVIESAISRRLPRPPVIAGIVVATVGLYLLTGADVHLGRGELFTLACAVLFAWHIVYIGAYTHVLRPLPFGTLQIAAVGLLSVAPAAEQGVGSLSALAVFAVVFTGVACSAVALPLQLWGQQRIPATRAALILLAEPVFAGIAGYVNGERLDATQLAGAVAIMTGIVVSEFWPRRPVPEEPPARGSVQP
jgi:drug/metabolite transporter (DMT)-like permease